MHQLHGGGRLGEACSASCPAPSALQTGLALASAVLSLRAQRAYLPGWPVPPQTLQVAGMVVSALESGSDEFLAHLFYDGQLISWLTSAPETITPKARPSDARAGAAHGLPPPHTYECQDPLQALVIPARP